MNRRNYRKSLPTIDMTPLMDLTFMLLIIFVITVPAMYYKSDVQLTPPESTTNDKMTVTYMNNKTLKSLKSKLKAGDLVLLDDNKSGVKGSGGHAFFLTGQWTSADNPYIWDFEANKTCAKKGKPRAYNGDRKVLAIVRLK